MTLQELGSIGEFVGSILLLVSIGYLALQVRQSSKTLSNSAFLDAVRDSNTFDFFILEDPSRERILADGSQSLDSLSREEQLLFTRLWLVVLRNYTSVLRLEESGVLEKGEISLSFETAIGAYRGEGIRSWWSEHRSVIAFEEYRARIDALLS